jgi:hypothetical protein
MTTVYTSERCWASSRDRLSGHYCIKPYAMRPHQYNRGFLESVGLTAVRPVAGNEVHDVGQETATAC